MIWNHSDKGRAVTVNVRDCSSLLADLAHRFDTGLGFTVATINLDHVVKLARNPAFREAYATHSHVTADGNPIVWLERLSGRSDIALTPGSELIAPVAALAAEKHMPVALFGATDESLGAAAAAFPAWAALGAQGRLPYLQRFADEIGARADALAEAERLLVR